jgi:hypothetical protein
VYLENRCDHGVNQAALDFLAAAEARGHRPVHAPRQVALTDYIFDSAVFFRSGPHRAEADLETLCYVKSFQKGVFGSGIAVRTGLLRPMLKIDALSFRKSALCWLAAAESADDAEKWFGAGRANPIP